MLIKAAPGCLTNKNVDLIIDSLHGYRHNQYVFGIEFYEFFWPFQSGFVVTSQSPTQYLP